VLAAALRLSGADLHRFAAIPFGPPLCVAIWLAWLGFDPILIATERLQ